MKRFIKRVTSKVDKANFEFEKKYTRSGWLAHHGIQRSGTNFLLVCLKRYGIRVINQHDPERNQPGHKHFRWYHDKSLIPLEILHQYGNSLKVCNAQELNKACNFPSETRHIVIYKERSSSLVSTLNWGLRVSWFRSKDQAISSADRYLNDIEEYYKFWSDLSETSPQLVQLVNYERIVRDNAVLTDALCALGYHVKQIDLSVDEVPMSLKARKVAISYDDVARLF